MNSKQFQKRPTVSYKVHRCETKHEERQGNHTLTTVTTGDLVITMLLCAAKPVLDFRTLTNWFLSVQTLHPKLMNS